MKIICEKNPFTRDLDGKKPSPESLCGEKTSGENPSNFSCGENPHPVWQPVEKSPHSFLGYVEKSPQFSFKKPSNK